MTPAYYNEIDIFKSNWISHLADAGKISRGVIDERSIKQVQGADLAGFRRAHFFAGIAGWDEALRLAGWPVDKEVWTGSCPCQPISRAGKQRKEKDERHLFPDFLRLISERRPSTIFGEQVAESNGGSWFAGVRSDLEGLGYRVAAADLCAASVGSPQIRQRIFWVADADGSQSAALRGNAGEVPRVPKKKRESEFRSALPWGNSFASLGKDGKKRRLESELEPMVKRFPVDVEYIRAYGDAICPQVASKFIAAYMLAVGIA